MPALGPASIEWAARTGCGSGGATGMVRYTIYFKSSGSVGMDVALEDTKLKADYLAYLAGARLEGRAYRKADGAGEVIVDFREISAIDVEHGRA